MRKKTSRKTSVPNAAELILPEKSKELHDLPSELFLLPTLKRPFFPGMVSPFLVESGPFYDTIKQVGITKEKGIGLVLPLSDGVDRNHLTIADYHPVGVFARILRISPSEGGVHQIVLYIEQRIKIEAAVESTHGLRASVSYPKEDTTNSTELKACAVSIIATARELLNFKPLAREEIENFLAQADFHDPHKIPDLVVGLTSSTKEELQQVLEAFDPVDRAIKTLTLLMKELDLCTVQHEINQKIEAHLTKTQKEYLLREQMKIIKKELGIEKDDKLIDKEKFESRIKERKVPPTVMTVIEEEMAKLSLLEKQTGEYGICRNYVDWLTMIPWGLLSEESINLSIAEKVLDEDHYGLKDIKERILEFISVGKLSKGVRGTIICLLGPPGVGKTSVGKSIARALNRKFYRFSVGGMRDEAEIKGHRRTYVGAMPGKIIQALKQTQSMNPVIMLDEIDKIGKSYHGDPASALLEVLDPEQNNDFLDHYLDVRCDLSNVLFIVTANVLDSIPEALKDRMEILRLSGYIMEEKLKIATKYLIPKNRKEMGIKASQISFSDQGLKELINQYAREAGVRNLENYIKKILRKQAIKIVRDNQSGELTKEVITPANLKEYIGKPKFTSDRFYETPPVGVAMGLAWTAMGGATLYIEAIQIPSEKTAMKLTGQAGEVMKESCEIAWNYLHSAIKQYAPKKAFFPKSHVHVHIPEGATPKDGPSAGITMVTSLLSLLLNQPIKNNLGMTGELTITGKILPVGGIKEKTIAARRSGLTTLIFPKNNQPDWEELPSYIRKGLTVHFVDYYDDVFKIAFES